MYLTPAEVTVMRAAELRVGRRLATQLHAIGCRNILASDRPSWSTSCRFNRVMPDYSRLVVAPFGPLGLRDYPLHRLAGRTGRSGDASATGSRPRKRQPPLTVVNRVPPVEPGVLRRDRREAILTPGGGWWSDALCPR